MNLLAWIQRSALGMIIGLAVSVAGVTAILSGALDRLDHFGLDLHFQRFGAIDADSRIVLIDIDDRALRAMPEWPWPRRRYAQVVDTLTELGASSIVLDLVLAEPMPPRIVHAGLGRDYDLDVELRVRGDQIGDAVIYDDDELCLAMREAGNVYLAMFAPTGPLPSDAEETQASPPSGGRVAAEAAAKRFLHDRPEGSWREFFQSVNPDHDFETLTPRREQLLQAYRLRDAHRRVTRLSGGDAISAVDRFPNVFALTPPLAKFAEVAKGVGFVTFDRDREGGVLRRLPLIVAHEGSLLPQLGFLVACDALGISRTNLRVVGEAFVVGANERRVPIDTDGSTLLNWHVPLSPDRWASSFSHVPILRVMEVAMLREARAHNQKRIGLAMAELVELRNAETPAGYDEYVGYINQRITLVRLVDQAEPHDRLSALDADIRRIESDALVWLRRVKELWDHAEAFAEQERLQKRRVQLLWDDWGTGRLAEEIRRADEGLVRRETDLLDELRRQVEGRICLVGYTASAMADLVTTPVYRSMPGVMAHANIINSMLQDRWPVKASNFANLLLLLMCGLCVTLATCARGPVLSLTATILIGVVVLMGGTIAFHAEGVYLSTIPALGIMGVTWACVTAGRQMTEERTRRHVQRALAQYTSPAVAKHIATRLGRSGLAPQRASVTCFFADLDGFTALSERLGPEQTRHVLNPYLVSVSRILTDRRAMVNKFMGDGVFAFFNAPILPCDDHAGAACASAYDVHRAINDSLDWRETSSLASLSVRIGLATGEVFVGDYGSNTKLDYTCIGGTVNTASRLERANKTFGTRILVDEATRAAAGEGFVFRSLGLVELDGLSSPCATFEMVGCADQVGEERRTLIHHFEESVRRYQAWEWDECIRVLAECEEMHPNDPAVAAYRRACQRHQQAPPAANFSGAVTLDPS